MEPCLGEQQNSVLAKHLTRRSWNPRDIERLNKFATQAWLIRRLIDILMWILNHKQICQERMEALLEWSVWTQNLINDWPTPKLHRNKYDL